MKPVPPHLLDRLSRRLKKKSADTICDEEFLKEFPYFYRKIKVNEIDKIKRWEAITYKIVKQIPSDNDKWYVKYNTGFDTYYIGKEDKKIIIVIGGSDDEGNKKRKTRKRKIEESVDEISQHQKKWKKTQFLVPRTEAKNKRKTQVKGRN